MEFVLDYILSKNSFGTFCSVWPCGDLGESDPPTFFHDGRRLKTDIYWWNLVLPSLKHRRHKLCLPHYVTAVTQGHSDYIFVADPGADQQWLSDYMLRVIMWNESCYKNTNPLFIYIFLLFLSLQTRIDSHVWSCAQLAKAHMQLLSTDTSIK